MKKIIVVIIISIVTQQVIFSSSFDFTNEFHLSNEWEKLQNDRNSLFSYNRIIFDKNFTYNYNLEFSLLVSDFKTYTEMSTGKKKEHFLRRFEVLFFGSLTIVSFFGWIGLSIFNSMIYGDNFGLLRRDQILFLYLSCSVISIAIAFTDLLTDIKLKNAVIQFY